MSDFNDLPKISLKQFKESTKQPNLKVPDIVKANTVGNSSIIDSNNTTEISSRTNMYHTYKAYYIENIRLDICGKYCTIGGTSKYIDLLGIFGNTTKQFAKQLIIIVLSGLDDTLEKLVDIYRELDDAIVVMQPLLLPSGITEDEVFSIGEKYGFTKVTDNSVFTNNHTFMILNTVIGKELIKMFKEN